MTTIANLIAKATGSTGSSIAAFNKNSQIGDSVEGEILEVALKPVTNFKTRQPEYWDDGTPQQQILITLQTDQRDPQRPDDTGKRALWIKTWGLHIYTLAEAVSAAGAEEPEVGGWLKATFDRLDKTKSGWDVKVYAYEYRKPQSQVAATISQAQAAPQAQATPQQAAPQTPATAIPANDGSAFTEATVGGLDLSKLTPEQIALVQQLAG